MRGKKLRGWGWGQVTLRRVSDGQERVAEKIRWGKDKARRSEFEADHREFYNWKEEWRRLVLRKG